MVSTTDFIVAIELGSSKIVGIAGKKNADGSIQILARAKEDSSSFVRKGIIFNLDKTAQSLTSIINKLESSLNSSIGKVYVGIGGQSLHTVKHNITRDLKDETIISQELIDAIRDESLNARLEDMDILDVAPQEYKVGNTLQAEPVGVPAHRIEGNFMNIVARSAIRKNLERCFALAKIETADILISPLVTAQAVLTESEMRSGCALIDFGAGTTTVSVYKGNILRYLSVIPLGGNNITHDIASLHMEEQEAEKLKLKYGNAISDQEPDAQHPETVQSEESHTIVDLYTLNDIIEARAEEIVANAWNQVELSGYADKLLSGITITGGGANLKNIDELLRKKSRMEKIRVAYSPRFNVSSAVCTDLEDGTQNTLFGLIASGMENCYQPKVEESARPPETLFTDEEVKVQTPPPSKTEDVKEKKPKKPKWFETITQTLFSDDEM